MELRRQKYMIPQAPLLLNMRRAQIEKQRKQKIAQVRRDALYAFAVCTLQGMVQIPSGLGISPFPLSDIRGG